MCLLQYFVDEREESSRERESDSEDEQPKAKVGSPPPTSQRVPVFPGLSPAALIVCIQVPCNRICLPTTFKRNGQPLSPLQYAIPACYRLR